MKLVVSNIDWDYPGKNDGKETNLPAQVTIYDPSPDLLEDLDGEAANLAEWLTSEYECCICGFVPELMEEDEKDRQIRLEDTIMSMINIVKGGNKGD